MRNACSSPGSLARPTPSRGRPGGCIRRNPADRAEGRRVVLDTSGRAANLDAGVGALAPMGHFGFVAFNAHSGAVVDASRLTVGQTLQGIIQGDAVSALMIPELIGLYRTGRPVRPPDHLLRLRGHQPGVRRRRRRSSHQGSPPVRRHGRMSVPRDSHPSAKEADHVNDLRKPSMPAIRQHSSRSTITAFPRRVSIQPIPRTTIQPISPASASRSWATMSRSCAAASTGSPAAAMMWRSW